MKRFAALYTALDGTRTPRGRRTFSAAANLASRYLPAS
jgi:hypothetical protein